MGRSKSRMPSKSLRDRSIRPEEELPADRS
jgi:hypothetical protein